MNKKFLKVVMALVILTILVGVSFIDDILSSLGSRSNTTKEIPEQSVNIPPKPAVSLVLPDFTSLVERESISVVNIQASKTRSQGRRNDSFFPEGDPFYEFFKRMIPNFPDDNSDGVYGSSFGSGFIISQDGYILTNAHVIRGMDYIRVLLNDKREYQAKLIGVDDKSDVAVLKIAADNLPAIEIGDPAALKVGEWVVAIGAPFGFDNSVTAGIVSAKGRSLPDENYTPFIQTDVAINPGNSGGPLFNLKGQVVGINSQIYSRSGGFMGISFAIPIDVAMNVAEQLKKNGRVQRGRLGVTIQGISYDLAKSFGLAYSHGALISQVLPSSAADKAGLKAGDIVLKVNGRDVKNSGDLPVLVGMTQPGQEITLTFWREGKEMTTQVILDQVEETAFNQPIDTIPDKAIKQNSINEQLGLVLKSGDNGLVILSVEGYALRAGLRSGDMIQAVGQTPVKTELAFISAVQAAGKYVPLLVKRGNQTLFFAIVLP